MDSEYTLNKYELNLTNDLITNDNLIATLNRKNLNSLNVRFAGVNGLDKKNLSISQSDLLEACTTGDTSMYKTNRQNGGGTEILLHHSTSANKSANKSTATSGPVSSSKHSTLSKANQLNQALNLSTPSGLIEENVKCSTLIRWLCSPPLLCVLLLGYACFGALLFHHLESGAERFSVTNVAFLRNSTLHRLWNITLSFNILNQQKWTSNATNELIKFERAVIWMVRNHGYNGFMDLNQPNALALQDPAHDDRIEQWTLSGALLYSLTIISTIGSGNLSPRTSSGKIATMVYALFGVPLMLCFLTSMGNILADHFRRFYRSCCFCSRKQQALAKQEAKQRQIDLQNLYRLQYLQQQRLRNRQRRKQRKKQKQTQIRSTNPGQLNDHFHVHLLNPSQNNSSNDATNNIFSAALLPEGQQLLSEGNNNINNGQHHNTVTFLEPDPMNKLASISSSCSDANCGLLIDHHHNPSVHHSQTNQHLVPTSSSQNAGIINQTGIHYCTISNRPQLTNLNGTLPTYCNSAHHQLITSVNQPEQTALTYGTTFKYGTLPNTVIINQTGIDTATGKPVTSTNCCATAEQQAAALLYNNQSVPNSDHYHLENYGNLLNLNENGQPTLNDNQASAYLQASQANDHLINNCLEEQNKLNNELNYLNNGTTNHHLIENSEQKEQKSLLKKLNTLNNKGNDGDESEDDDFDSEEKLDELDNILDDPLLYSFAIELSKEAASHVNTNSANKVQVPLSLCMILILIYVALGAIILHIVERRNLLDAIYYCFLTLSTIGYNSAASSASNTVAETPFGNGFWLDFVDKPTIKKTSPLNSWSLDINHHTSASNSAISTPIHYGHTSSVVFDSSSASNSLGNNLNAHNSLKTSLLGSLNIAEPNNQLLVLFAIYLLGGMLLIAMCFNLVQDHLVLRVLNRYELINKRNFPAASELAGDHHQSKLKSEMDTDDDFDV